MATVPSDAPAPMADAGPQSAGSSPFGDDAAEAEPWIAVLQSGTRDEKIRARDRLARLCERRAMLDEAAELYERNILVGVRDPGAYTRLATVYRRQGRLDLADEVLAEAAKLSGGQPLDTTAERTPAPWASSPPSYAPVVTSAQAGRSTRRPGRVAAGALGMLAVGALAGLALVVAPLTGARPTAPLEAAVAPPPVLPTPEPAPVRCALPSALAAFRDTVGVGVVGECELRLGEPGSTDVRYSTTRGELVQRAADGRVSFTDGSQTWLQGPNGVQNRLNTDRYSWERTDADPTFAFASIGADGAVSRVRSDALLPKKRIVSYYGHPLEPLMGVLGQGTPQQMMQRLKRQAEAYASADPSRPVVPAIQLITPVASTEPGADGLYRVRVGDALIEQMAKLAEENGALLILDIQPGRSSVRDEVTQLLPYLKRPYVQLALDPEFTMPPGTVPLEEIGTLDAADVNWTIDFLNDLVVSERLPPKVLIVHRFLESMVTNYRDIRPNPRVQVVMDMDGFGAPAVKISKYEYHVGAQAVDFSGIKLFYDHDKPLMTPRDVLALDPLPDLIIYQ